jgi:hypothetical protein
MLLCQRILSIAKLAHHQMKVEDAISASCPLLNHSAHADVRVHMMKSMQRMPSACPADYGGHVTREAREQTHRLC